MQLSLAYIKWREETLHEGKAEGKAEVAINLLRSGMDCEQVVQLTGLSMELVLQLARESGEATD
jgi:predicted transposase YdaD